MKCIYCNHTKLYTLKTKQLKCARCKKKFSIQKIILKQNIINVFISNQTAYQAHKTLNINYITIQKYYIKIRHEIALYLEEKYNQENLQDYDEYVYLEKSKISDKKNIFDAHNFITFQYENKVYNLLMPSLQRYKEQFIADNNYKIYYNEFKKFMRFNKISKVSKKQSIIVNFWKFLEDNIVIYKGISYKNFFYYLKEFEFKFNYTESEQKNILYDLII